jgi:Ca2+/H+ antiporter, TMEM165/GDT1 family
MIINWAHAGPSVVAAFLASLVEFVEALTVILTVGTVRGWRGALSGAGVAVGVLLAIIAALGPALTQIPLGAAQLVVGALLLLFGLRWLRKAVLRYAGVVPLRDETAAYAKETESLRRLGGAGRRWDKVAFVASFKITMLEGIEVVFIVIAVGAGGAGLLFPASFGALAALLIVIVLGIVLHRPLASIPENLLKFGVGVLLSAFGCFWFGEGIGLRWPEADWSILGLIAGFFGVAALVIPFCPYRSADLDRAQEPALLGNNRGMAMRWVKSVFGEIFGLFVDDGNFALAIIVCLAVAWLLLPGIDLPVAEKEIILFIGLAVILTESTLRHASK